MECIHNYPDLFVPESDIEEDPGGPGKNFILFFNLSSSFAVLHSLLGSAGPVLCRAARTSLLLVEET